VKFQLVQVFYFFYFFDLIEFRGYRGDCIPTYYVSSACLGIPTRQRKRYVVMSFVAGSDLSRSLN
jgi:hypothetical protein